MNVYANATIILGMYTKATFDHGPARRKTQRKAVAKFGLTPKGADEPPLTYAEQRKAARKQAANILSVMGRARIDRKAQATVRAALNRRLKLYKPMVIDHVRDRFETEAAAEEWFDKGTVPGFDKSARQLVLAGRVGWVLEAIDAINAGVHA